jgi:hypothetical protein
LLPNLNPREVLTAQERPRGQQCDHHTVAEHDAPLLRRAFVLFLCEAHQAEPKIEQFPNRGQIGVILLHHDFDTELADR